MTIKELGDSFFDEKMEKVIDDFPYMSFVILSVILEFIAKCRLSRLKKNDRKTHKYCKEAIENIDALKKYSTMSVDLYTSLRCPMIHNCTPKDDIILSPNENGLETQIIGAKELHGDLHSAWKEICDTNEVYLNNEIIIVNGELSGLTTNTSIIYKESTDSN